MSWTRWTSVVPVGLAVVLSACGTDAGSPVASPSREPPADQPGSLGAPEALAFAADGNLYVSEFTGNKVDVIDEQGEIATVAGTGSTGLSGDGGPAIDAELSAPTGMAFDTAGNLLIVDHDNGCVRTVDAQGQIDPLIGMCGERGFSGDGGQATEAMLDGPVGVVFDADGRIYVSDEQNGVIRRVNADGSIETVAGEGSIPAATAPDGTKAADLLLNHPSYMAIDADERIYFSDFLDNVVMRIERSGRVTRIAGTGDAGFSGDGGPAIEAELEWPTGLALDGDGNLFISDANNHRIRMVDVEGTITTFVGTGEGGYSGDGGPAVEAQVQAPSGLAFDPSGRLVIADQGNNLVRLVDDAGVITTIAGVAP
jgi:DNA-binding beta-propeller fold protein YncE